jgi:hypothetical protein
MCKRAVDYTYGGTEIDPYASPAWRNHYSQESPDMEIIRKMTYDNCTIRLSKKAKGSYGLYVSENIGKLDAICG